MCACVSKNTRPLLTLPDCRESYRIQMRRLSSEFDTYSVFSSGENAIPFGRVRSLMMTSSLPVAQLEHAVERHVLLRVVVLTRQPVGRIGEEQRAVGSIHEIVRRVQPLALETVDERASHADRRSICTMRRLPCWHSSTSPFAAGGHAVRPDEAAGRKAVAVVAAGPQQLDHCAVGRPLAHDVADDIAEPQARRTAATAVLR